jgi:ABC-2 type transport system ATP-binding protein
VAKDATKSRFKYKCSNTPSMVAVIKTKDLTKMYGKLRAVDKINLSIEKGEIFGFLGPNGAGKTTTIGMLTTIVRPTSGTALVNGYSIEKEPGLVRSSIGIVFQDFSVDTILTGRENLEMSAQLYGMPKNERKGRIDELLELVDLKKRAESLVGTYSGGMKRRLELIRGLLHKPAVLFLDEPTLGLDPQSRVRIWKYIKEMAETENTTIMLTTHYMEEAEMMCDRLVIIDRGRIIMEGKPVELKKGFGGDIVYLKGKKFDEAAIKALKFVKEVQIKDNHAKITVENASTNLPELLKNIQDIEQVEVRNPTLNDVFLASTGRHIRDDSGHSSWMEDAMRYSTQGR